jgi:D-amino peptidase
VSSICAPALLPEGSRSARSIDEETASERLLYTPGMSPEAPVRSVARHAATLVRYLTPCRASICAVAWRIAHREPRVPNPRLKPLFVAFSFAVAGLVAVMDGCNRAYASVFADGATTSSPAPRAPNAAVRVLLYHDMEGLAGQDDWRTYLFSHPEKYPEGQKMLAADLNAVIDGLFAGGATQVDVVDAHGSGNPDPDVRRELLDPRAQQVFRDADFDPYVDIIAPNAYDAVAAVAMHAKTGSRGFASHTITLGMEVQLNGVPITESEIVGYSWGRVGVPMIFVSGDDRLRDDLKTMPWIEYVVSKKATSASTVELIPVGKVHAEMREKAARAVRNIAAAKIMTLATPLKAGLRAVPPASLASLKGIPGITYADQTVTFSAPDFRAAYDGVIALVNAARASYPQLLGETVRKLPDAKRIMADYSDALFMRWMDYESGRWQPPAVSSPVAGKRYHGDR